MASNNKVGAYCILCGNHLDPKMHIRKLGKTSSEVAKFQAGILRRILKGLYFRLPNVSEHALQMYPLVKELEKLQERKK